MKHEINIPVQRNYKDTLFRMIFQDRTRLLSLYNALNGTDYSNPDELEIVTLQNAIYMNMKNDLAFVIDCSLNIYEHQSTYSPNLPIRNLFYISRELEKFVFQQSLYSSKLVKIPTPRFLVFYNGNETDWSKKILRLSDAYKKETDEPELELIVTMININHGKNDELLEKCSTLFEYMEYVEKVRTYAEEMEISQAVNRAVEESIREGILKEFLIKYRAEAIQMSIFEYDEEKELKLIRRDEREIGREEGRQEGKEEGKEEGRQEGKRQGLHIGIQAFILDNLEEGISKDRIIEKLVKRFDIQEDEARQWVIQIKQKECIG